ncbi:hypothetical protein C8R45DRAFT_1083785 [Mycena sanguinolenta]|nr:hypothetical protein C8R45DRAFT_1083785 [Mycena sanguinolenta]
MAEFTLSRPGGIRYYSTDGTPTQLVECTGHTKGKSECFRRIMGPSDALELIREINDNAGPFDVQLGLHREILADQERSHRLEATLSQPDSVEAPDEREHPTNSELAQNTEIQAQRCPEVPGNPARQPGKSGRNDEGGRKRARGVAVVKGLPICEKWNRTHFLRLRTSR